METAGPIANGNVAAWLELCYLNADMSATSLQQTYLLHRSELEGFLRARCKNADGAQDLLQDLWLKLGRIDQAAITDPLAYLYRMANNLVFDRQRSVQQRSLREEAWQQTAEGASNDISGAPSAERIVAAKQQINLVDQSLRELGERTYRIVRRFRIDEIGQRQIAEEEGISVSAVEKHLQKAYRTVIALRARLDAEWIDPERLVMVKEDNAS